MDRLADSSSIFMAESEALLYATNVCKNVRYSLSVIKAIHNVNHKNATICRIRETLIIAKSKIKLMWIPRHTGLYGNSIADEMARNNVNAFLEM